MCIAVAVATDGTDKDNTSYDDLLDAIRLGLKGFQFK